MLAPRLDCKRLERKVKQAQDDSKNKAAAQLLFWCILRAELDLVSEWLQDKIVGCGETFEALDLSPISRLGPLLRQAARPRPAQPPNALQLFVAYCDELLQIRKCMLDNFLLACQMLHGYEGLFQDDQAHQFIRNEMLGAELIKSPKLLGLLEKARFIALVILQQKEDYSNSKGLVKGICAKCSLHMADPIVLSCGDTVCTWCLTNHVAATGKLCPVCPGAIRYYVPHVLQGVLFDEANPSGKSSSLRALRFLNPIEICTSWGAPEVLSHPVGKAPVFPGSVAAPPSVDSFFSPLLASGPVEQETSQAPLNRLATWAANLFSPGISSSTLKLMEGAKDDRRSSESIPPLGMTELVSLSSLSSDRVFSPLSALSNPEAGNRVCMNSDSLFCDKESVDFHISTSSLTTFFGSESKSPFGSEATEPFEMPFAHSLEPDRAVGPPLDDAFSSFHDAFTGSAPPEFQEADGTYRCQELSTCLDTHWIKPCLETHGPEEEGVMYFQNEEWGEGLCENPLHHLPQLEKVALNDREPERTTLFPRMNPCLVPSECPSKMVRVASGPHTPAQHFHIYPHQHSHEHEHFKRKHNPSSCPPPSKRHDGLSSCHQCKCKKLSEECALCSGGKFCRKKFCSTCLKKHYNTTLEGIRLLESWVCPACSGICLCAACNRDRVSGPPQSPKLSCHQCKGNKQPAELTFCASDASLRKCRKKYCWTCLLQYGNIARPEASTSWECPACRDFCSCANCKRRRDSSQARA